MARATQSVPALERGLKVVELLATSRAGLTLPQIATLTGLPRSSVHCMLITLQRGNYVRRDPASRRYSLGVKLLSLAESAIGDLFLTEHAAPHLFSLMHQTGLIVHMAVLVCNEAVLIARIAPPAPALGATWIGKRMGIHCTAVGKALIAGLPEPELNSVLRSHGLPRQNENTIVSVQALKEDLERTRRRGYALDDEEDELGFRCIGVPVLDEAGGTLAAISVSGTVDRIAPGACDETAARLKRASAAISRAISAQAAFGRTA